MDGHGNAAQKPVGPLLGILEKEEFRVLKRGEKRRGGRGKIAGLQPVECGDGPFVNEATSAPLRCR
jgi:hypothetical protein